MKITLVRLGLTVAEKAKLVCWFEESKSMAIVAKKFREQFHKDPPHQNEIQEWHKNFLETGSLDRSNPYTDEAGFEGFSSADEKTISDTTTRNPMV